MIELFSLALTIEVPQGKTCQDSLLSGEGRSLGAKISGEVVVPGEYFLVSTKLDTFCYLTVQTASCYVPSFWHNTGVWQTDGWNCHSKYSTCNAARYKNLNSLTSGEKKVSSYNRKLQV